MLWELSAREAAEGVREGRFSAVELVTAALKRIEETDADIRAWVHLDAEGALQQAAEMDRIRKEGRPTGRLHGVPVAVKDIFETDGMPTALGWPGLAGRQKGGNARTVEKLREAGAVILGKTTLTPFAFVGEVDTRNPHNTDYGSGGSSSGSAAAVAAGHVPLALGTQTNGSVIRPASFCGTYGFKPTRGLISREGILQTSETLDQVGVLARSLEDLAVLTDCLMGFDRADPGSLWQPKPDLASAVKADPPVEPCFAWIELPYADRFTDDMASGIEELLELLGDRVERVPAPKSFEDAIACHKLVHEAEFHRNLSRHPDFPKDAVPEHLVAVYERGGATSEADYQRAVAMVAGAEEFFRQFFKDYDAVITPASLGQAPKAGEGSGDPICSTIWTFAGLPCLSLPWLESEAGLPSGVQLVGGLGEDDRLLRTANWLENWVEEAAESGDDE